MQGELALADLSLGALHLARSEGEAETDDGAEAGSVGVPHAARVMTAASAATGNEYFFVFMLSLSWTR
ncbi:hypothetical protein I549_0217 [Mycobacterium avium subsp. avium 2285 (R)]|nr:hypothetical protein I549_0217 [Mycobacterium avium subsp. avium 2285 (R)]